MSKYSRWPQGGKASETATAHNTYSEKATFLKKQKRNKIKDHTDNSSCLKKNQNAPRPYEFKKFLNASKPSEHPPQVEEVSKGLGGNIGCRDKTSSWYQKGSPM